MRRIYFIFIIALIMVGVFLNFTGASFAISEKIVAGVHVGSLDLSDLSVMQANERLKLLSDKLVNTKVNLLYGENTWTVDAKTLGVSLDYENTLQKAIQIGHTGSILNQLRERHQVKRQGANIDPVVKINLSMLKKGILVKAGEIIREPVNAGFQIMLDDTVKTVPGRMGTKLNYDTLQRDIIQTLAKDNDQIVTVELPLITVPPQRDIQDILTMGINGLISRYDTQFDAGQVGRTYNIKVAAAALDDILISPEEEFSFNRVVGPRSSEAGYKNANVIINNELVQGLGGGVCQVSSTLYNAVLLANLKVTDRSNHSLPVSYVPIGRDATVVYDAIDFRFRNNKNYYIYVKSSVVGNTLTIKIFGNKEAAPRVEVASWVTETINPQIIYEKDPHIAIGEQVVKQKGNKGYKTTTVRYIWENGEKNTETLPDSFYRPSNRIIAIGAAKEKPSVVIPLDEDLTKTGPHNLEDQPSEEINVEDLSGADEENVENKQNLEDEQNAGTGPNWEGISPDNSGKSQQPQPNDGQDQIEDENAESGEDFKNMQETSPEGD